MTIEKRKALGRGLETLLPRTQPAAGGTAAAVAEEQGLAIGDSGLAAGATPTQAKSALEWGTPQRIEGGELREIALEEIERNPFQTRTKIREDAIEELAASIRANGVMQPIVVRAKDGKFQLIAGERRWLASKKAGKSRIPALVKQVSDQTALEMTIIENIQREDLGPMEQARAFERLSREFGMTQEMMAARTGKDRATVANYLRLLKLPFEVQMELENNFKITLSHAKLLLMLDTEEEIKLVAKEIAGKHLSVVQTEDFIFNLKNPVPKQAKPARVVDPNVREAERELERSLGCRVRIKDRKGRGKIVIEYANLSDFDRVVEKLS